MMICGTRRERHIKYERRSKYKFEELLKKNVLSCKIIQNKYFYQLAIYY